MSCLFCQGEEFFNHHGVTKQYKTDNDFVCSRCTQLLIKAKPENLQRAYDKAVKMERVNLIKFLENYLEEKDDGNQGAINNECNMDREGTRGTSGTVDWKRGKKYPTIALDSRRPALRRKRR
jgi:hypothetical protein